MNKINEKPILFSAAMVKAILDGSKTQTRRVVKPCKDKNGSGCNLAPCEIAAEINQSENFYLSPYGKIGDRIWVRETWRGWVRINPLNESPKYGVARYVPAQLECNKIDYKATSQDDDEPYRPSIHMPRWASRINLEITNVRVERLRAISEEDAKAEGIFKPAGSQFFYSGEKNLPGYDAVHAFRNLWQSINGVESWESNPWVWVIEFKRI